MKYRLSIIIPVFNTRKYILECVHSLFVQLPKDVEVVIVNDGTEDDSIDILKHNYSDWLRRDQVVLIEQKNMGPGAARNLGVIQSRGRYIGFLDSDDILLDGYFSSLFEIIVKFKPEIIEFGMQRFSHTTDLHLRSFFPDYGIEGLHEINLVRNRIFKQCCWFSGNRVYKREVILKFPFAEGVFYEDLMTIPFLYMNDLDIYFLRMPLVAYRINSAGTTSNHTRVHARQLYLYFLRLTNLSNSTPIDLLKVQVARTLIYFMHEMENVGYTVDDVLSHVKLIKKSAIFLNLKFADLVFLLLPKTYIIVDYFRLSKRRKN